MKRIMIAIIAAMSIGFTGCSVGVMEIEKPLPATETTTESTTAETTTESTTTEAETTTETTKREPSKLSLGYYWTVEPTLDLYGLRLCHCDNFASGELRVDDKTGEILLGGCGHGGGPVIFVYDPERDLIGYQTYDESGYALELAPQNEFDKLIEANDYFANYYDRFLADKVLIVESVDSSIRESEDRYGETAEWLPKKAFNGNTAVMYNGEFITDFDFFRCPQGSVSSEINDVYFFSCPQGRRMSNIIALFNGEKHGIIDRNGDVVIPFDFDDILIIDEDTAFAKIDGVYGILDITATAGN